MPLVSVIIPNYNHEKFLEERIQSVLNQSYQDFELIILDDFSTDGSREVIERYRDNEKVAHILFNSENSGTTFKQWKKGIDLASGKYIWIAESDDYASAIFLETLIGPLLNDSNLVISYCRSVHVDEGSNEIGLTLHADQIDGVKWTRDYIEDGATEIRHFLQYINTIPNASAVVFKKPGNLDKILSLDMKFCGDWLFWQNLLRQPGAGIAYSAKALNFFRTHANTTRHLTAAINVNNELRRFKEYKSFVPKTFINPFDNRFRWMMAEWIDRGMSTALRNSSYRYFPVLHPTLMVRYYMYALKKKLKGLKFSL